MKLTKPELKALERLFADEIRNALPTRFHKSNKAILSLQKKGLASRCHASTGKPIVVKTSGWCLTPSGHMTWCLHCSKNSCNECDLIGEKACSHHGAK